MERFAPRYILSATDFSDISTLALRHAVLWARRYGARLTVLHVQEPPPVWSDPYLGSYNVAGLVEAAWEGAKQRLAEYVPHYVPTDVPVRQELLAGSAPAVIEEFAEGGGVDLVVLGTHGRSGLGRLLLGSVAERALRMARRPTLIVRRAKTGEGEGETPRVSHILCPVNYSDVARAAFEHAASVAQTFGARRTVLYAAEHDHLTPQSLQRAEEELEAWLPAVASLEYQMQPVVRGGNAAEQAIRLAREAAVDLIVIGAQHRRFFDATVLGVTTVRVTRHAPCPVLVVPRSSEARA